MVNGSLRRESINKKLALAIAKLELLEGFVDAFAGWVAKPTHAH